MVECADCESHIETRWSTCPACGTSDASLTTPNLSIVSLVEQSDYVGFNKPKKKSKKKLKSKCCEKYQRRNKSACKRCPLFAEDVPTYSTELLNEI